MKFFWGQKKKTDKIGVAPSSTPKSSAPKPPKDQLPASQNETLIRDFEAVYDSGRVYISPDNIRALDCFKTITDMSPEDRAAFLLYFVQNPPVLRKIKKGDYRSTRFVEQIFSLLIRRKAAFTPDDILTMFMAMKPHTYMRFQRWPLGLIVNQLGKSLKQNDLSDSMRSKFADVLEWKEFRGPNGFGVDVDKARLKIAELITEDDGQVPVYPLGTQKIGLQIQADLDVLSEDERQNWHRVFNVVAKATGSKPTKKFTTATNAAIDNIETAKFKSSVQSWLGHAAKADSFEYPNSNYGTATSRVGANMQNLLKGLVWAMARFHDEKTLAAIAALAARSFTRLPGVGPAAPALGNACIYTLANSKGLSGVAHLSRLKLRVKQNNTQKLIQKSIEANAKRLGLKPAQIEDMAAPDFGLTLGRKDTAFKDYKLRVVMSAPGKVTQSWIKPDGSPQKTPPSFVKDSTVLSAKLKDVRAQIANIKKASTAQRDRIDRLYTEDMRWSAEDFSKYYLNHGLVGPIARQLIWQLSAGDKAGAALYVDETWQNSAGKPIEFTPESYQLWHPIMSKTPDVLDWRARLDALQIRQPFKQAYREIYILTEAEINTRVYSNRMAAHILKQHQFNNLAAIRGWAYSLMGAYDDGRHNTIAVKNLPAYDLSAEFWVDELNDMDSFNDAGIWDFIATDQVRFKDANDNTLNLIDVPPLLLSEILRDTDLFVGVASIGNDPAWNDRGGAPRANTYWQSYSFGDLSETAKTRKAVLETLLPRLKIRDVAHIDGKFLIVNGKRNSYKIHIGSSNILIMPEDKYLCIVPGRGKDKNVDTLFLPFEGDRGLSIVLSKAFMLAEDTKIKDPTILSQLAFKGA